MAAQAGRRALAFQYNNIACTVLHKLYVFEND